MRVDYVRVYQKPGEKNIGCDPPDFPTAAYINECVPIYYKIFNKYGLVLTHEISYRYIEAYTNPNLTTWVDDYGQTVLVPELDLPPNQDTEIAPWLDASPEPVSCPLLSSVKKTF